MLLLCFVCVLGGVWRGGGGWDWRGTYLGDTLGGRSVLRVGCKRPACVEELPTAVESGWSKNQSVMLSQSGMMIKIKNDRQELAPKNDWEFVK